MNLFYQGNFLTAKVLAQLNHNNSDSSISEWCKIQYFHSDWIIQDLIFIASLAVWEVHSQGYSYSLVLLFKYRAQIGRWHSSWGLAITMKSVFWKVNSRGKTDFFFFWTSYVRSIYVLCLRGRSKVWLWRIHLCQCIILWDLAKVKVLYFTGQKVSNYIFGL